MPWDHKQSVKEILRHVGFKLGAGHLLDGVRRRRGFPTGHLDRTTPADRFRAIYELGAWVHSEGQQSLSGLGSEVGATISIRDALPSLLVRLKCRTLLDVGCGDWSWMRDICLPCNYLGIDVVPEIIENNSRYERAGVVFRVADAIAGPLPEVDVALCREVLFHLSFNDGLRVLANIQHSARWLLGTTDTAIWFNSDVPTGDFRRINLQRSPYRLPPPRALIADDAVAQGRVLGLWETADLVH
jgi:SAM-dependent methyltransferase